jgi:SAM-dependent methyltransferase
VDARNFDRLQVEHNSLAESARHVWLTTHPLVRPLEEALLKGLAASLVPGAPLLEVGCGEGSNLVTLRRLGFTGDYLGLDFSPGKVSYAQARHGSPSARFLVADARSLPLRDRAFPVVLCRDVLHHLEPRAQAVAELARVCGERLVVIEPNPKAPLIFAFGLASRAERGMLRSGESALLSLLRSAAAGLAIQSVEMAEPLSLARLLCHYQFGPLRGAPGMLSRAVLAADRTRWWPRALFAYRIVELRRGSQI